MHLAVLVGGKPVRDHMVPVLNGVWPFTVRLKEGTVDKCIRGYFVGIKPLDKFYFSPDGVKK